MKGFKHFEIKKIFDKNEVYDVSHCKIRQKILSGCYFSQSV